MKFKSTYSDGYTVKVTPYLTSIQFKIGDKGAITISLEEAYHLKEYLDELIEKVDTPQYKLRKKT